MARSIWNGVVSFGLVSIPVRLYPATSSKDIAFNELHTKCHGRLKRIRWCPVDKYEVPADEVIKGYEYTKGQYVELTDEDFESLPIPSKHTVEVTSFVKSKEIDPVYYDSSYVLEPEEAAKKPYALFMHALKSKEMVAVARITIRKKEQLCSLRPEGGNLMLETLYFADELRVELGKELPEVKITEQEEKMAEALVDLLAGTFDAKEYKDTYREALMQVIEGKLEGKQIVTAPTPEATKVTDLMEALRASVEAAKKRRAS
ncbi:MAG TPA: Ku protein [Fimbriimonadaceae bacterium]|jgi:DNA end-binding protein Ku